MTGYPPHAAHQPKPRRKTSATWIVLGGVAAAIVVMCGLGVLAMAALSNNDSDDRSNPAGKPKAAIGQPARDGKFEFTVQTVKCGVTQLGSSLVGEKAQGQFCLVTVHVKNVGAEAKLFTAGNQKAHGPGGVEYSADTVASVYANKDGEAYLNDINPGNAVTAVVVFDIPADARLVDVELHDSAFSGGIVVAVGP